MERFNQGVSIGLVFVWIGLIFSFSSQDAQTSSALPGSFVESIVGAIEIFEPNFSDRFDTRVLHSFIRSSAHFFLFFFLGIFSLNALRIFFTDWFRLVVDATLLALITSVALNLYGALYKNTMFSMSDIFINGLGALMGTIFLAFLLFKEQKNIRE